MTEIFLIDEQRDTFQLVSCTNVPGTELDDEFECVVCDAAITEFCLLPLDESNSELYFHCRSCLVEKVKVTESLAVLMPVDLTDRLLDEL